MHRFGFAAAGFVLLAALSSACGPSVDLAQALQVTDVSTGFYDVGIVNGQNKLVPSVTFRIRNTSDQRISGVSLMIVFRAEGETEDWDDVFVQRVQFGEDGRTEPIVVRTEKGYTGTPPMSRADMLQSSYFKDLTAKVFAKQSSSQWIDLHTVTVERRVLTR